MLPTSTGVETRSCCRQAIALRPDHAEALHNLGVILHNQGLLSEALACFDRAITLKPGYAEAHNCRGVTLQSCGKLGDAIQSFRKASALAPLDMKAESNLLFCHNYHPALAPEEVFAAYCAWNDKYTRRQHAHAPFSNSPDPERRLRIGYVSPDFRNHSVIHFAAPLIEAHDRSGFEVSCYYNHSAKDAYTERLIASADHWVQCGKMSDEDLAQRIRSDGIDILVDLAGHTAGNRLLAFALKPAPVQATWMGYGYTTGMDVMDYFIGDHAFTPQGCDHLFSERIWRLPHTFATYLPPATPEPAPSPALRRGYVTFACLSRSERINDRMIAAWAEILCAVPDARLRLDSRNFNDKAMRDDFASRFAKFDISPSRLETGFTSPVWQVYNEVDIVLDCFPHNSGATTYEALWMGNPVVTLAGRPSVGRLGSSVLSCLGRTEWIATDVSEYVACAVSLASNLQDLARIRSSLRGDMLASRLLDRTAFARDMEAAYRGMWKDWCAKRD